MRVFSLTENDNDIIGFDDDGVMLNLTKAISLFDRKNGGGSVEPVIDIETLIWEGNFNGEYLSTIMEFVAKAGVKNDCVVKDGYAVNPPVYPGKIIALGQNYMAHIKEMGHTPPEKPVLFGKWPSCVIGHGDDIEKPSWIGRMDYEAELAFVIGKSAKNVDASTAMEHVAGYTCLNDVSARDLQKKDIGNSYPWMMSKNFDTFAPLGPCILLAEAVKQPVEIDVRCSVNGEQRQNGNTRDFIFDIPTMIAYISSIMTLESGDVVTTGTPSGVGPIEPGDVVEVSCSGIGTLRNTVVSAG